MFCILHELTSPLTFSHFCILYFPPRRHDSAMSSSVQIRTDKRNRGPKTTNVCTMAGPECLRSSVSVVLAMFLAMCISICLRPSVALSQDDDQAATEKSEHDQDAYQRDIDRWRQVMVDAFALRNQFNICEEHEAADLRKNWHAKIAEGDKILQNLRISGLDKYSKLEKPDKDIGEFLIAMANKDVADQQYETAATAFNTVFDSGLALKDTNLNGAGVASFCTNDFARAERYFRRADELNVLGQSKMGPAMLGKIDEMKAAWNREQLLRQLELASDDLPKLRLVTNQGEMVAELFENDVPNTVANFIALAENGFFDGHFFFEVNEYVASTGSPTGNGKGGPGYSIENEATPQRFRGHFRGSLTTIVDDQGLAGSKFSICNLPMPTFDGKSTCFGRVISGMEVLGKLKIPSGEAVEEEDAPKLIRVEVISKRDHDYQPKKYDPASAPKALSD